MYKLYIFTCTYVSSVAGNANLRVCNIRADFIHNLSFVALINHDRDLIQLNLYFPELYAKRDFCMKLQILV